MEICLAKTAGFCFGVNKAMDTVYDLLSSGKTVCTLGPIIHNPQVVRSLEEQGVRIVERVQDVPPGAVLVIRSHGVPAAVYEEIEQRGVTVCDATCPFVAKIHRIVAEYSEKGCPVLIAGDETHPEVIGIRGHCTGESFVFSSMEQLESLVEERPRFRKTPVVMVSQTTFNAGTWKKCSDFAKEIAKKGCTNWFIFDTICSATEKRQQEAVALSQKCDIMVIVGGRESSNTAKLRDVCAPHCPTLWVETAAELPQDRFSGARLIGLTAGASTPADIIKEVQQTMSEIIKEEKDAVAVETVEKSFEEMSFEEALEASLQSLTTDEKVRGIVVAIAPNEVQVEVVGRKQTGYIPADELSSDPTASPEDLVKIGDELELLIMRTNDQEGTLMLSKKRIDAKKGWEIVAAAAESGEIMDGVVAEVNKGGVIVVTNGVRVFVPASHATLSRVEDLSFMLKQPVRLKILEVEQGRRRRVVGSIRLVAREARKEQEAAFWAQAEVGQKYTGEVKSLTSYGAFVDLGGVDGMVHISELSWGRVKHPSEVVKVGDMVEVYIRDLDAEKKKISLGYRKAEDNPWEKFKAAYEVGSVVTAKVVGMTAFGAFAQIIPGIDGLIHISQIANRRIEKPQDELKVGQEVTVKITNIDYDNKRISLSIRALLEPEEVAEEAVEEVVEEAAEETAE